MTRSFRVLVFVALATGCNSNSAGVWSASSGVGAGSGLDATAGGGGVRCGPTTCASAEVCCLGLDVSCVAAGSCQGIPLVKNDCSGPSTCQGAQVCCSTFLGPDGGLAGPAALDGGFGHGVAGPTTFGSVSIECVSACPTNGASFQACDAENPACPSGFTCQPFPRSTLQTPYCLPTTTAVDGGSTSDAVAGDRSIGDGSIGDRSIGDGSLGADASEGAAPEDASVAGDVSAPVDVSAPSDVSLGDGSAD